MVWKRISQKLEENEYRLTPQREVILQVMIDNRGKHLSADEVYIEARGKSSNIGIATVYRTLEKLASIDVLYKTIFEGGKYRYELSLGESHQHHHIICLQCGHISEVEEDLLHNLEIHLEKQGYKILDHELKFYGYCPQCNPKN